MLFDLAELCKGGSLRQYFADFSKLQLYTITRIKKIIACVLNVIYATEYLLFVWRSSFFDPWFSLKCVEVLSSPKLALLLSYC